MIAMQGLLTCCQSPEERPQHAAVPPTFVPVACSGMSLCRADAQPELRGSVLWGIWPPFTLGQICLPSRVLGAGGQGKVLVGCLEVMLCVFQGLRSGGMAPSPGAELVQTPLQFHRYLLALCLPAAAHQGASRALQACRQAGASRHTGRGVGVGVPVIGDIVTGLGPAAAAGLVFQVVMVWGGGI